MTAPANPQTEITAGLLSVDEARARILALAAPVAGIERVTLRSGLDRVLAADVHSTINVPPYTNSAMDGYAINSDDIPGDGEHPLVVIGKSFAGLPFDGDVKRGECVRIMTGAVVPEGADTVVMQEHARRDGDTVVIGTGHKAGQNVRHPGEDMAIGDVVVSAGRRLLPADLGVLASLGVAEVSVYRKLRVAFFSTGDELRSVGEPLGPGQIYDSNRYTLYGMLHRLGVDILDMGVIPDNRELIAKAFEDACANADVVMTSGGVSVGEADFVKETLDRLGQVDFWKIAMKPGKPLACGQLGQALFFGLPGNPVSVMATFYQFAQPALRTMMGEAETASLTLQVPCANDLKKQPGRTDFQRGWLATDGDGQLCVHTTGLQGSHVLTSMSKANCFIILPAESGGVPAGTPVTVQPFAGLV